MTDDYWALAVKQFTGYPVPSRDKLFDAKETPLFHVDLEPMGMQSVNLNQLGLQGTGDCDYNLVFYTTPSGDGQHDGVKMVRAKIHFDGVPRDGKGAALVLDPGSWTSVTDPIAQYVAGSRAALNALHAEHTTGRFPKTNGLSVAGPDVVDLKSFERTAQAFDRAKKFFEDRADTLQQWEKSLGEEQASWKGQAAEVFRALIIQLRKNYESYVEQLGGRNYDSGATTVDGYTSSSKFGDAVAASQEALYHNVGHLRGTGERWADRGRHLPHRWLLYELDNLNQWLFNNNITQVLKHGKYTKGRGASYDVRYSTTGDFRQTHPDYGDLSKPEAWKKVGEAAVKRWTEHTVAT
ncbi:AAWKG family protein, partial [Streptomyces sp. NPDC002540]